MDLFLFRRLFCLHLHTLHHHRLYLLHLQVRSSMYHLHSLRLGCRFRLLHRVYHFRLLHSGYHLRLLRKWYRLHLLHLPYRFLSLHTLSRFHRWHLLCHFRLRRRMSHLCYIHLFLHIL